MATTAQPSSRTYDFAALVRDAWGPEFSAPDVVYQFSNGREFVDSGSSHGIYNPQGS